QGLPQKTDEDRRKESKPIIPEDCTIEVVSWHPADPQKQTETAVYEIRGGVVTSRLPTIKEPEIKGETFRREGYEITRTFEGRIQGNVIVGTWTYEGSKHQAWGWPNTNPNQITSHCICKTVDLIKLRLELHLDGTVTSESSGENITEINRLIGAQPGVEVKKTTWPTADTPAQWRQPGQGVWQFRAGAMVAVAGKPKPTEPTPPAPKPKPPEPRISTQEPPTKFRLPPEKLSPAKPEPTSQGRRSPTDEQELDEMPPWAKRKFDALPPERKNFFRKYHYLYGLGWRRSGKLLAWLSDPKLPRDELEVRAQLLLAADHRYQQLYKTVVSTAVTTAVKTWSAILDNLVEEALWKVALKSIPAVKWIKEIKGYVDLVNTLATVSAKVAKHAATWEAKYQEASDADRVLEKFVASYGKSEAQIVKEIRITKDSTNFWKRRYEQAQAEFQEARLDAPSAGQPLASDPQLRQMQREASQKMLEAVQTMRESKKELKDLDLEEKALELRLKALRGEWKSGSLPSAK
ncbi:MAG: hypothetical protein RMI90_14415, partial [Thermoguttaceae bacterium]|nr:hypothetical protein [Thermoguttaceae bacterium]